MIFENIYNDVINSFGSLWNFKERGNSLEIITPFATTSHKFISVFITKQGEDFIVSDGGWIADGGYSNTFDRNIDCYAKIILHYIDNFDVRETNNLTGAPYFYKKIGKQIAVPSLIFDMANFISSLVSLSGVEYEKEKKSIDLFSKSANDYLSNTFVGNIDIGEFLDKTTKHVKPNAIIKKGGGKVLVLNYITGSTVDYFRTSIAKSTVIFELAEKSILNTMGMVEKNIAFVDDKSPGFVPSKVSVWLDNLTEKPHTKRVDWTKKEELLQL